ncbi:hypothetical protein [Streptomyces sp. S4.7]|uniref:hypothetical protein n=1 Tax=Streptomyces sp. S4.7 TaxID=2705439 RepID=UPI0013DD74C0|nr:hypothetical protein [Streptomyces sp. S4.7]
MRGAHEAQRGAAAYGFPEGDAGGLDVGVASDGEQHLTRPGAARGATGYFASP